MREEKTFRVVVFRFETDASTNYTRYMITKNYMPFFPGNQWLELKSIRKTSTGKEYYREQIALWREKQVRFSAFPIICENAKRNAGLFESILKSIETDVQRNEANNT